MKVQNNNRNESINQLTCSNTIQIHKEQLLQTLLQQGQVVIQYYKISLKKYKHLKTASMQELRGNLRNLIKFYDKHGRQNLIGYLPEQTLLLVEEYKNKKFQLSNLDRSLNRAQPDGYKTLFKTYLHINFSSLKSLSLADCKLQSIQSIAFIHAPFLQSLSLTNNKLSNVNALIKSHFPKLTRLSIDENYIKQTSKLSRFNSNQLQDFWIQFSLPEMTQQQIIQDVRFLVKFNYQIQQKKICIANPNRNTEFINMIVAKLNRKGNKILLKNCQLIEF